MDPLQVQHFQIGEAGGEPGEEFGLLKEYYQMCRRYGNTFFEENPGNTIYHLVLEDRTLLFTFSRGKKSCSISYLAYGKHRMAEAWLHVLEDIQIIRQDVLPRTGRVTNSDLFFEQNLEELKADINRALKPFSFIISSLPAECFPQSDQVRLYNAGHIVGVSPEEILIPLHRGDREAEVLPGYGQMRETMLSESSRPARKSDWELFRTDSKGKRGRRKITESVPADKRPDCLRMRAVEEAFSRLWEK